MHEEIPKEGLEMGGPDPKDEETRGRKLPVLSLWVQKSCWEERLEAVKDGCVLGGLELLKFLSRVTCTVVLADRDESGVAVELVAVGLPSHPTVDRVGVRESGGCEDGRTHSGGGDSEGIEPVGWQKKEKVIDDS